MIFSALIVGAIEGKDAHCKTFFESFPIAEMFCNITGKLWTILTDVPGDLISPFLIILIPLRAVHEKSPLVGFTA